MPGEYRVFSSKITGLRLTNTGDVARLLYPDNTIAYEEEYTDVAKENYSYALIGSGWNWTDNATPGVKNIPMSESESKEEENTKVSKTTKDTSNFGEDDENSKNLTETELSDVNKLSANLNQGNDNTGLFIPFLLGIFISVAGGSGFWFFKKKYPNL